MRQLTTVLVILVAVVQQVFSQAEQGKFRLSADIGYGYRLAKVETNLPEELEDYLQDLKSGVVFEGSASYQIGANWGLGGHFSRFLSQESTVLNLGSGVFVGTADNIRITYLAPFIFFNNTSVNGLHTVASSFSIGYLRYTNNTNVESDFFEISANTFGVGMGLNYDFHITENFSIGAGLDLVIGSYSNFEVTQDAVTIEQSVDEVSDEDRESLSRVALTVGMKVYL